MFKNKKVLAAISIPIVILIIGGGYYLWSRNRFDPEEYERIMSQAQEAYEDSKYSESLELYLDASELAPRQFEPYSHVVQILSDKGRYSDARNVVKGVIVHLEQEEYSQLWLKLGEGYEGSNEYYRAAECYEQAYKYTKSQGNLLRMLDVAVKADDMELVDRYISSVESDSESLLQMMRDVEELKDEDSELLDVITASQDYISGGYYALAIDLLEAHDSKMENYWEGNFYLGRAYYEKGDFEEAVVYFDSAVSLGSDDPTLYLYFARAYDHLSEKNSSYNYYERAVSFVGEEDRNDFVEEYSTILIDDQQFNRAEDLIVDNSEYIWSQVMAMRLYWAREEYSDFAEVLKELEYEEVPVNQRLEYLRLVSEYYLYQEVDLVTAEEYIGMIEDLSWSYLYKGMFELEEGSEDDALSLFNSAIDSDLEGEVTDIAELKIANM